MKFKGEETREIIFPIGGIGTGSIGLAGDGHLMDWEIYNIQAKGSINPRTHFAVKAIEDDKVSTRVVMGDIQKDFMGQRGQWAAHSFGYGYGPSNAILCGLPHFKDTEFDGEFPVAKMTFNDEKFPGTIVMNAFNPFIPCDSKNSSIPGAFFEFEIKNTQDHDIKYQLAFSVGNPFEKSRNRYIEKDGIKMVQMYNSGAEKDDIKYGDLTIATSEDVTYHQTYWYRGGWCDEIVSFWNDFDNRENLKERMYDTDGVFDKCTIAVEVDVKAGESKKVKFILTWNMPNQYNYWREYKDENGKHITWKNWYATVWEDSTASAVYSLKKWDELISKTMKFKETLYNTTVDEKVLEAAATNLSVLKTATTMRLEDGSFYGWEGCGEKDGSCEGTCQHVWNYAYAMCYFFPDLERSIRDNEFKYSTTKDGKMAFRMQLPVGRGIYDFRACVDGQMGSVLKCYREWKISGDNKWLKDNWENIKKIIAFAWHEANPDRWDRNKDGVLEGRQHHTLDMELFGPSSWLEGFYLAALKAGAEMADFLGDEDAKKEYLEIFKKGYNWTRENLFNGEYFIQKLDLSNKELVDSFDATATYWNEETKEIKYQICNGSSIDQMTAQWHADILGLGDIFDPEQVDKALDSMMKNNYKTTMRDFANFWRLFSIYDEAGSVICVYPEGVSKPKIPIPYCEETMTGFEYAFSGLLMSRGKYEQGYKVVKAVRDRFDGLRRNPWNEYECGSNYARSMASFANIAILSGYDIDMPNKHIGFNPHTKDKDYSCIWSVADGWGNFEIKNGVVSFDIFGGALKLKSFGVKFADSVKCVKVDGKKIAYTFTDGKIVFDNEITVSDNIEVIM